MPLYGDQYAGYAAAQYQQPLELQGQEPPKSNAKYWVIGGIVVIIVLAIAAAIYFMSGSASEEIPADGKTRHVFSGYYVQNGLIQPSRIVFVEEYMPGEKVYLNTAQGKDEGGPFSIQIRGDGTLMQAQKTMLFSKEYPTHSILYGGQLKQITPDVLQFEGGWLVSNQPGLTKQQQIALVESQSVKDQQARFEIKKL